MNVFDRLTFDFELLLTSTELCFYGQKLVSFFEHFLRFDEGDRDRLIDLTLLTFLDRLLSRAAFICVSFYILRIQVA